MSEVICPICGPAVATALFEKKQREFYECNQCKLRLQWPLPTQEELERYYDEEFSQGMYRTFTEASLMKQRTASHRLRQVLRWAQPPGKWLDVGCANGVFVSTAASVGADAYGIELSGVAVEQAVQQSLKVQQARIEDLSTTDLYDCITAFDVIEHVLDPRAFLQSIADRLTDGGTCVLSLPDVNSLFAKIMGKTWWFYIPEEHLHYFNHHTMKQLVAKTGLETLHAGRAFKPLTFDYGLTQFKEFNPLIYRILNTLAFAIPKSLRSAVLPFYIGEMLVVLRKPRADLASTEYRRQSA